MKITRQQLTEKLRENNGEGIIVLNGIPLEVKLTNNGNIQLTGDTWDWVETTAPSAHGDYVVEADQFMKISLKEKHAFPEEESYEFYKKADDYLDLGF